MATTVRIRNNLPLLQKTLSEDRSSIQKAGAFLEGKMVEKINSNIPPPLSPKTIAWKQSHSGHGGSLALVATTQMRQEITTKQIDDQTVGVGVYGSRAGIAEVHEFGALSKGIPERSFIRSTANENKKTITEVFGANLKTVVEKTVLK